MEPVQSGVEETARRMGLVVFVVAEGGVLAGERWRIFATKQMLKINMLQIQFFSVRFGVEVGCKLSWRYVGWSLQYAGFARLTRIGGLNCTKEGGYF